MEELSDEALAGGILRGDDRAFEEIMSRYQNRIYSFCLRYLGNEEDAREVFQETFLRAYTQAHRFTPRYRFSTWLYTLARNQCLDRLRRRSRRREQSYEELAESDPGRIAAVVEPADHAASPSGGAVPDPREEYAERELDEKVRAVMGRLPARQREVILLRHYSGLTFAEIADSLGCSVGTAKSRFHFGFRKLARLLRPLAREM